MGGSNVSLTVTHPDTGGVVGCYSPCSKLTSAQFANPLATGHAPWDAEAAPYCCSTLRSEYDCSAGPMKKSKFVETVHRMCPGINGYAYDSGMGLLRCPADTKYQMTFFCPADSTSIRPSSSREPQPPGSHSLPPPSPSPLQQPHKRGIDAWEVVWSGGVRVRETKNTFSSVLGHKDQGAIVHGWKDGHWLHLVDEPGFMMISLKGMTFLKQVNKSDERQSKTIGKIIARKYFQHVADTALVARPISHWAFGITAVIVSLGICMRAAWRNQLLQPSADIVENSHNNGIGIPLVIYRMIPEDDRGGCNN